MLSFARPDPSVPARGTDEADASAGATRGGGRSLVRVGAGLATWAALIVVALRWGERWRVERPEMKVGAAPFFGRWDAEVASWSGVASALGVAGVVVVLGPRLAGRLPWRAVVVGVALVSVGWLLALNAVDGPGALGEPIQGRHEYIAGIPDVRAAGGPRDFLATFTAEIDAYPTHVRGHPPGLVVALSVVDDAGLQVEVVGIGLVLAGWAAATTAALIALRATAGEAAARRAAPFLVLLPAAVWAGTSFDALFAGTIGVGVAAIVVATARPGRWPLVAAAGGGVAVGIALLLSYSVAPLLAVPVAVAVRRRRVGPLVAAGTAAAAVLVAMALVGGFWWPDGLAATRGQYHAGVAALRPFSYFVIANLAVVAVAVGPALAAGLSTVGRRLVGPGILLAGALVTVVVADLSGLSKAEVERIWLPFVPWLATATAFAPDGRRWAHALLAAQAAVAIAVQVLLRTPW